VRVERLTGRDEVFLYLEGPTTPYSVGALVVLEPPAIPADRVARLIEERLHLLPRFRQRLEDPGRMLRPVWVDDRSFTIADHVHPVATGGTGGAEDLRRTVATLMEGTLDRDRPLWDVAVLEGLAGDRTALLVRVHHAAIDGMAGARDLDLLFDASPKHRRRRPPPWHPGEPPTQAELMREAVEARRDGVVVAGRALARMLRHPSALGRMGMRAAAGVGALADVMLHPAPAAPINVPVGPRRAFDHVAVPLEDLRTVKTAFGCTINDVVLAAVTGGIRELMLLRGEPADGPDLKALVPVSIRPPGDLSAQGNLVAGILAPLPVGTADVGERLAIVAGGTDAAKRSPQTLATTVLLELPSVMPRALSRAVVGVQRTQRFLNISVTNVRGPAEPLYLDGRRVTEMVPALPLSANCALIAGAMSYAGMMQIAYCSDRDAVPEVEVVAAATARDLAELVARARG
jgi:WS/DGAT/MGAT family acyltransferase